MPFEFVETLTLELPHVEKQLTSFGEGESGNHGLIIEIAAIHEGLTANYNRYSAAELEKAVASWVTPFPKPVIKNHDPFEEPLGRVMAAKMDSEADGTPFTRLQVAITDPAAIEKISDKRYLTGSVGGKADEALCSICSTNWAEGNNFQLPCKHIRGNTYKGKLAYIEMKNIKFKEYSFVNMPADGQSHIRSVGAGASADAGEDETPGDGWVRAARIFDLNMDKEEITEFTESETRDVLSGMKKKDASPLYLQLKGAFLSALATEAEQAKKESNVEEEEDILAVTEGLSADLAAPTQEEEEEVIEEETPEDPADEDGDADEETPAADADDEDKPEEDEEDDKNKPEGQAKPSGDVDPETSKGAPVSREGDDPEDEAPAADEETKDEEEEEPTPEEAADDTDLNEEIQTLESRVSELETREQALLEENAKLKAVLKKSLAERVVDTKIALGVVKHADREETLAEHEDRTPSSLRDALRDLAEMSKLRGATYEQVPTVDGGGLAVEDANEERAITVDSVEIVEKASTPEDVFVDVLMGRRKL